MALIEVYRLRILYRDAEARNVLYDTRAGNVIIIDFEGAELRP